MTSAALLEHNPAPSAKTRSNMPLKDTLCRCAGYPSILGAVQAAAQPCAANAPVEPPVMPEAAVPGKAVWAGFIRARMPSQKVTGLAIYTDDIQFEGMLHARVKRAMVPSRGAAQAGSMSKARALPGVAAVLTAADIPGEHNPAWSS